MKKLYRAHPLMILGVVKPFLFIFILPVVKAFLQYFTNGEITDVLGAEILLFLFIVAIAAIHCFRFRLSFDGTTITVKSGFVVRKISRIEIKRISSIQMQQSLLDVIFGAVTYRINTEAGSRRRSDFKFKLSRKNSKELYDSVYNDIPVSKVKTTPFKVAIMSATTSSAVMGMIIAVPVINWTGKLLGVGINEMLFDEINNVSNKIETYFPPIVNTITLILLLGYIISFIYTFAKYVNFSCSLGKNSLEVKTGLFVRTTTVFKKRDINNVKVVQAPLMLLFGRYSMKVSVGGFGETKAVSQIVVPSGKWKEIQSEFEKYFSFLTPRGDTISSPKDRETRNRFLVWPTVYLVALIGLAALLARRFSDFDKLILFLTIVVLGIIFYHAYTCVYEYRFGKISFNERVFACGVKGFNTCSLYCPKEKIGQIKITRFWRDFAKGTCKVRITVSSEGADSIRVRFVDYEQTVKQIENSFNLSLTDE